MRQDEAWRDERRKIKHLFSLTRAYMCETWTKKL
jgi:hypothetical protein